MSKRKILLLGNSHVRAVEHDALAENLEVFWIKVKPDAKFGDLDMAAAHQKVAALAPDDLLVLMHWGTQHNIIGLLNHELPFALQDGLDQSALETGQFDMIPRQVLRASIGNVLANIPRSPVGRLIAAAPCQVVHVMPPPPKEDLSHWQKGAYRGALVEEAGIAPAAHRLALWDLERTELSAQLSALGVDTLLPPPEALTKTGFLKPDYHAADATHANAAYGALVRAQLIALAEEPVAPSRQNQPVAAHPYKSLPDKAFWRRSVSGPVPRAVDPVGVFDLTLQPDTKVATAGSCFAQHVARHLKKSGFHYYVAEEGHPILPAAVREAHNYGTYSARYGNLYTARQLWQLFERAYGRFTPQEAPWHEADGQVRDPFRPTIQPGGFASVNEMEADRAQHLAAVREMFETLDVFVFTLGLTECWESRADGAVFPLCPGVEGGVFDPEKYAFRNQDVTEVLADMNAFIAGLQAVNPAAQILLTVSPVPLMATAEPGANVLSATTYSKSVLRVAAEMLRKAHDHVHYFPSYEVITGSYNRGAYFAEDLRNVTEEGVGHVMGLILQHATADSAAALQTGVQHAHQAAPKEGNSAAGDAGEETDAFLKAAQAFVEVECDEVALDRG